MFLFLQFCLVCGTFLQVDGKTIMFVLKCIQQHSEF